MEISTNPNAPNLCAAEFNIVTNLMDDTGLKKMEQEMTDILKYRMDLKPGPMCYMEGNTFQGYQGMNGERRPPPALLDVQTYLTQAPLLTRTEIDSVRDKEPPPMPPILSNRLIVPDCRDILTPQRTKNARRTDQPEYEPRWDQLAQRKNTEYARFGRDTRQEWRDQYKIWDDKKKGVYGIGKYDKGTLKPVLDVQCEDPTGTLPCMHIASSGAHLQGPVLDPALTLGQIADLSSTLDSGVNLQGIEGGGVNVITQSGSVMGPGREAPLKNYSQDTIAAAQTIDSSKPYLIQMQDVLRKEGCKRANFYGYNAGC